MIGVRNSQVFLMYIHKALCTLVMLCICLFLDNALAQAKVSEYEIRAIFIHNLLSYVSWPAHDSEDAVVLCMIGDKEVATELANVDMSARNFPDTNIKILEKDKYSNLEHCDAVYIGEYYPDVGRIVSKIRGMPILSLSSAKNFMKRGGAIGFSFRDRQVQLKVNIEVLEKSGLEIAPDLLGSMEVFNHGS